jgi:heme/copper-type cytochrome/quinol oxidase subunit 2
MFHLKLDAMTRMSVVAGIGLAMAIAGFVYGVVAVGVPAQDPTPAQADAERLNLALSGWVMAVGGVVTVTGIVGMAVVAARRASGRGV